MDNRAVLSSINEAVNQIDDCLNEIDQLNRKLADARQEVQRRVLALAAIEDKNERLRIVRHLYWYERRVNASALAAALLIDWDAEANRPKHPIVIKNFQRYTSMLRRIVGPIEWVPCSTHDCSEMAPIKSRTKLDDWIAFGRPEKRHGFHCEDCEPCPWRPVPAKDWRTVVAEHQANEPLRERQRHERKAAAQAEMAGLVAQTNLDQDGLVRLYELMSWLIPDTRR